MKKQLIFALLWLAAMTALAQEKQGHVMRPKPRGTGTTTVVGQALIEVEYALNATDISDPSTYLDLHVLLAGKELSKHFSRDSRSHIHKLQVKANRDHLRAGGARDMRTGELASKPHPYEPLEKE